MDQAIEETRTYTAFAGHTQLVTGPLETMLRDTKQHLEAGGEPVLIFEDWSGTQVDFDFSGSVDDVLGRVAPPNVSGGPGRPRLGVVSREVSLLPRHWEWLEEQPNGISAALRRLVDQARKQEPGRARARRMIEAASKVMWVLAGNLEGFEEASRALFARDRERFVSLISGWPVDIRVHLMRKIDAAARLEEDAR